MTVQRFREIPQAILEFQIATALTYAIDNWDLFHSDDLISEFRKEIIDDVISGLKEDGYFYE